MSPGAGTIPAPRSRSLPEFSRRVPLGFTLLEILVAIAVMGVGITIFISFFSSSLTLAQSNRYQTVATQLAVECLQAVTGEPERYDWHLNPAEPGVLVAVTAAGESAQTRRPVSPPATLPVTPRCSVRDLSLYKQFTWQAYARLPKPDASYVEVTVAIRWNERGRECVFTLTSTCARARLSSVPQQAAVPAKPGPPGANASPEAPK